MDGKRAIARGLQTKSPVMPEPIVAQKFPYVLDAKPGTYFWCACGGSKSQPFCDGSHKGTEFAPVKVDVASERKVAWCGCKHSKNGAFCDGSHKRI
jgi:CDGSH-type Zn-finger protein